MSLIKVLVDIFPYVLDILQVRGCSTKKKETQKKPQRSKHPVFPKQMNTGSLVNRPGLYSDKFQISVLDEIAN